MNLYTNMAAIEREPALIGYVRVLRRAWEEFSLSSVLCVGRAPALYQINSERILAAAELKELHRKFWNQGVASVLLVIDPKTVYVLSGLQPPVRGAELFEQTVLPVVVQWQRAQFDEGKTQSLYETVSNGEFYREYTQKFQAGGSVDAHLTGNLLKLRDYLAKVLSEDMAHDLICRLLFVCYIVDRDIYALSQTDRQRLHEKLTGLENAEAIDYLYNLFNALKGKFNGSMFAQDLDAEKAALKPQHMGKIKNFLRGDEVNQAQETLGFWAYDFKLIPIETISGIYENFLGREERKGKGAYYTPRFLAEMTIDVACEKRKDWAKLRYFDPSCGSGVFLVTLFNRIAAQWELDNRQLEKRADYYEIKSRALRDILQHQIRGMDVKLTACTLACFSLYVALLDFFKPSDIKTYLDKSELAKLPLLLLRKNGKLPEKNSIPAVCEGDTLGTNRLEQEKFDVVIGNPPWVGRGAKQYALEFVKRASMFLAREGRACLLLPSKIFFNINTDEWQKKLFASHTIERVVQLADFRHILFPQAKCPCMIVRFGAGEPADVRHEIIYDTPKFDASSRRQGFVRITETDRKAISQSRLLQAADEGQAHILWKRFLWGTRRDERLLEYLEQFSKIDDIAGETGSGRRWTKGQGVIPDTKETCAAPKTPWWKPNHLFIHASSKYLNAGNFLFVEDSVPIGHRFPKLTRDRKNNRLIFEPPMLLINQGFSKVVFSDFPVLFQDTLLSIHSPIDDEDLLLFLAAYLKSDLAKYYCFHTSSTLGIERDVVQVKEILKLPFPLPETAPTGETEAQKIVSQIAKLLRGSRTVLRQEQKRLDSEAWLKLRKKHEQHLRAKTTPLIYKYFGLLEGEQWLVEDTASIYEPSSTPGTAEEIDIPTLCPMQNAAVITGYQNGLQTYAETLAGTLNAWAAEQKSKWRVQASGGVDKDSGLALVRLQLASRTAAFKPFTLKNEVCRQLFENFAEKRVALQHERQIFGFDGGDRFHILRPVSLVHWTRTAALNDADEIYALTMKEGGQARE